MLRKPQQFPAGIRLDRNRRGSSDEHTGKVGVNYRFA
jgi:hypothetical protein